MPLNLIAMFYADYPATTEQPIWLSKEEWLNPKLVISTMFEVHDYADLKQILQRWLKNAMADRKLARRHLYDTLDLKDDLVRLLEMASLLKSGDKSRLPEGANWMDSRWWLVKTWHDRIPFDYFPVSLGAKAYQNPYRVFSTCLSTYSLPAWRKLLDDCWLAGLTTDALYFLQDADAANDVCRLLPKLLDAAHLIYVRELCQ